MTKIYLVSFKNESGQTWDCEAFTNLRKAKTYQRYWNAVIKNEQDKFNGDVTELKELTINKFDYEEFAIKEEMKELPY